MPAKKPIPQIMQVFLPTVAVALFYVVFSALPHLRELREIRAENETRAASVDQLRSCLQSLAADKARYESPLAEPTLSVDTAAAGEQLVALELNQQSFVEAFARVLTAFQSRAVECTAANPLGDDKKTRGVAQRISLMGSFGSVLAAIETIEAEIPNARITELSMERADPREPCRWDIAFQFSEAVE